MHVHTSFLQAMWHHRTKLLSSNTSIMNIKSWFLNSVLKSLCNLTKYLYNLTTLDLTYSKIITHVVYIMFTNQQIDYWLSGIQSGINLNPSLSTIKEVIPIQKRNYFKNKNFRNIWNLRNRKGLFRTAK